MATLGVVPRENRRDSCADSVRKQNKIVYIAFGDYDIPAKETVMRWVLEAPRSYPNHHEGAVISL